MAEARDPWKAWGKELTSEGQLTQAHLQCVQTGSFQRVLSSFQPTSPTFFRPGQRRNFVGWRDLPARKWQALPGAGTPGSVRVNGQNEWAEYTVRCPVVVRTSRFRGIVLYPMPWRSEMAAICGACCRSTPRPASMAHDCSMQHRSRPAGVHSA